MRPATCCGNLRREDSQTLAVSFAIAMAYDAVFVARRRLHVSEYGDILSVDGAVDRVVTFIWLAHLSPIRGCAIPAVASISVRSINRSGTTTNEAKNLSQITRRPYSRLYSTQMASYENTNQNFPNNCHRCRGSAFCSVVHRFLLP